MCKNLSDVEFSPFPPTFINWDGLCNPSYNEYVPWKKYGLTLSKMSALHVKKTCPLKTLLIAIVQLRSTHLENFCPLLKMILHFGKLIALSILNKFSKLHIKIPSKLYSLPSYRYSRYCLLNMCRIKSAIICRKGNIVAVDP